MSEKVKQFRVAMHYQISGECVVDAKTEKEAMEIAEERLAQDGVDDLSVDVKDRDYGAHSAELVDYQVNSDIKYGEIELESDEKVPENVYHIEVFLFDMDDNPGTPYHQEIFEIRADREDQAMELARTKAHSLPDAAGVNLGVECDIV